MIEHIIVWFKELPFNTKCDLAIVFFMSIAVSLMFYSIRKGRTAICDMRIISTYIISRQGKPIKVYQTYSDHWFLDEWDELNSCFYLAEIDESELSAIKDAALYTNTKANE